MGSEVGTVLEFGGKGCEAVLSVQLLCCPVANPLQDHFLLMQSLFYISGSGK